MSEQEAEIAARFKVHDKVSVDGINFEIVEVSGLKVVLVLDEYERLWCKGCHPEEPELCDDCFHNYNSSVNVGYH